MATYLMFGKYSSGAMKHISAERTKKAVSLLKKYEGKLLSMYALFGNSDLLFIVNFPIVEDAMKASVALSNQTGISFATTPAVSVPEFDEMMSKL